MVKEAHAYFTIYFVKKYVLFCSIWICMNMKENSLTQIYPFTARRLRPLRWEMNCVRYQLDRVP